MRRRDRDDHGTTEARRAPSTRSPERGRAEQAVALAAHARMQHDWARAGQGSAPWTPVPLTPVAVAADPGAAAHRDSLPLRPPIGSVPTPPELHRASEHFRASQSATERPVPPERPAWTPEQLQHALSVASPPAGFNACLRVVSAATEAGADAMQADD